MAPSSCVFYLINVTNYFLRILIADPDPDRDPGTPKLQIQCECRSGSGSGSTRLAKTTQPPTNNHAKILDVRSNKSVYYLDVFSMPARNRLALTGMNGID